MRKILLFILSALSCSAFSQTLTNSLTACYAFMSAASEPVSNLTGTLSNVTQTADRFNYPLSAYVFSGTANSYIELPDNPLIKPSNNISFSAWVKPAVVGTAQIVFTKNTTTTNIEAFQLGISTSTAGFSFQASKANALNYNVALGTTSITANTWYHVAFTMDNSMVKLYVNGVLEAATPASFTGYDYAGGKNVYLGGSNEPLVNQPFNGTIDNVKFYNRALSASEVEGVFDVDPSCTPVPPPGCDQGYYGYEQVTKTVWASNWGVPGSAALTILDVPQDCSGIAVGPSFGFNAPNPTYWAVANGTYWYHNGYYFVNTGHLSPGINPGGSKNYLYNLVGQFGPITVYNGTGNATTLINTIPGFYPDTGPFDVVGDDQDNLYVLFFGSQELKVYNSSGVQTCSYSINGAPGATGGAGLAIQGNKVAMLTGIGYYVGTIVGSAINFTLTPNTIPGVLDYGSCMINTAFISNITASPSATISCFTPTIILTVDANALSPVGYSWSGPGIVGSANTQSILVNTGGNYTCSLISCQGGTSFATFNVQSGPFATTPTITATGSISCVNPNAQLSVLPNTALYNPVWSGWGIVNGANTPTATVISGGIYTVAITNTVNNCVGTGTINVLSEIALSITNPTVCSGNSTFLNVTGGSSYTWSPGGSNAFSYYVTPQFTTIYTVTAQTGTCTLFGIGRVSVSPSPTLGLSATNPSLCIGGSTTITVNGANTYSWYPGGMVGSTIVASPQVTTIFYPTGTTGPCFGTASVNIVVDPGPPTAPYSSTPAVCEGTSTAVFANNALSYTWQPGGQNTASVIVTPSATIVYSVSGTNALGCISINTVVVTVNPNPTITVSPASPTLCLGSSRLLTAFGGNSYSWGGSATYLANPTASTIYTLTGYNTYCASTVTIGVTVFPVPTLTATMSNSVLCKFLSNTLTVTGDAVSYVWSPGNQTNTVITVAPLISTNYTVTGLSALGCTAAVTTSVIVDTPTIVTGPNGFGVCGSGSVVVYATGANSYTWFPGGVPNSSMTVFPLVNTTYTVIGTSVSGCTTSATRLVSAFPNPTIVISAVSPTLCQGASTTLSVTGAIQYTWFPSLTFLTSLVVAPLSSMVYTATGYSANSCLGAGTIAITVNPNPTITVSGPASPICTGAIATLSVSGATSYTWNPGNYLISTPTVTPPVTTVYTVTGSALNCTSTKTLAVNVNPLPAVTIVSSPTAICSGTQGTLTASGASNYTWNPGNFTTQTILVTPLVITVYTVTGESANCLNTNTFTLMVNQNPTVSSQPATVCSGMPGILTASGAVNYYWNPGNLSGTSITVTPLTTTQYTVTGMDLAGCTSDAVTGVTVNPTPTISIIASASVVCAGNTVTLNANGALNYSWTPGNSTASTLTLVPASSITYSVTGSTASGCTDAKTISLIVNPNPTITVTSANTLICAGETVILTASGASTYSWNSSVTSSTFAVSPSTTTMYTVNGTANNGCMNTFAFTQNVSECTDIPEMRSTEESILIYPNPNNGEFNIVFGKFSQDTYIEVYNSLGQLLIKQNVEGLHHTVNLKDQAGGAYLLIITENGKKTKKTIIKMDN